MRKNPASPVQLNRRDWLRCMAAAMGGALISTGFTATEMMQRPIPATGELLPAIGLGTWQTFDAGPDPKEQEPLREVLRLLAEKGARVIDSSPMYGRSEQVVGELTEELHLTGRFFMGTKIWTTGREAGIKQMQESMRLMKAQPMDLMQIHNLVDWRTHLQTLRNWKAEKKIRYLGITHYHSGAYAQLEQVMRQEQVDFLQLNYSLASREAEERLLPLAREKGIAVLVNQPFESGSLFKSTKGKPLPPWAAEYEIKSWAQFFIKYLLAHPAVTCVIPGTSKPTHLLDNLAAGFGALPDEKARQQMVVYLKSL